MLHTAEFPFPGSQALYAGELVRIHQRNNDGTALIFAERISKRVPLADLAPAPAPSHFDRWRAERLSRPGLGGIMTPVSDIAADFRHWLDFNGAPAEAYPASPYAFERQMREAGFGITRARCSWGEHHTRIRRCYAVALRTDLGAAA